MKDDVRNQTAWIQLNCMDKSSQFEVKLFGYQHDVSQSKESHTGLEQQEGEDVND